MPNDEQKIGLSAVIAIALVISAFVVFILFFSEDNHFSEIFPRKEMSIDKLLDRGRIDEVFDIIAHQPDSVQKSDTSLLSQGKAWYLLAWKRYESENWKDYAKDPNDWFPGSDVENALHCLSLSAQSEQTWADAATLIGVIYMEKGWYDKAGSTFQGILRKDADQRDAFLYYGVLLSRVGQYENAVRHLERWNDYLDDYEFLKNLFYLYSFNIKDYQKAAVLGDLYLKSAPREDISSIIKVKRELNDLSVRFPEYFNDTMTIIKDRLPDFRPKKR